MLFADPLLSKRIDTAPGAAAPRKITRGINQFIDLCESRVFDTVIENIANTIVPITCSEES